MTNNHFSFVDRDRWDLINSFRGGATFKTWQSYKGNDKTPFDDRRYGTALLSAYPNLMQNARGIGSDSATLLLVDGLSRRSSCMVIAALLANAETSGLNPEQAKRLGSLVDLSKTDPDLRHVFAR